MSANSDAELAIRVIDFLHHELGPGPKITLDSRLAQDLGVAGDDGDDLMENFAKAFDVDLTGLDFLACFGHEGTNPFLHVVWLLFPRTRPSLTPISVSDLVEAAKVKHFSKRHAVPPSSAS